MTETANNQNEPQELNDAVLDEVVGGRLPYFMYDLLRKFEPEKQDEILNYYHNNKDEEASYRYLVAQLRSIHDNASAEYVRNQFYSRYCRELSGC